MKQDTVTDYEPLLETDFLLALDPGQPALILRLVEVCDLSERFPAPPGFRDPFSLLFLGPAELSLAQSMYKLERADGEIIDLFLVPVGEQKGGLLYEATFN